MANTETFSAEIKINNQDATRKIRQLNKELEMERERLAAITREGAGVSKETLEATGKRIKELKREIESQNNVVQGLKKSIDDLSNMSYKELSKTVRALNKELRSGDIEKGSEKWNLYAQKVRECRKEMAKFDEAVKVQESTMSRFLDYLNKNWGAFTQILGVITGLSVTIRKSVADYAAMEQEMADVRKYTGQTAEEVAEMNEELKKMDTRTPREELNKLAGAAGRLGITTKKQILEFVDASDKIGVALGDDLGKGAVDTIGKLAIAFGESDRLGLRGAMLATGSALNEIVQSSSAQAQPVVDFTQALSGVGQQAHLTQAAIMGYASALDQNNQEMATSSTVMSQLITKMYQDPAKFAKMAGLEVGKFKNLVNTDMNEAMLTWFKASQKLGDMSVLAGAFDNLGMDGTRAVGVLATLAGHIDQVVEAQNTANKAYEEATSVIKEFNTQNETVQSEMDKAKNHFKEVAIELGEKLKPIVAYTISSSSLLVKTLSVLIGFVAKYGWTIASITASIIAYNVTLNASNIAFKAQYYWLTVTQLAHKAWAGVVAAGRVAAVAYDLVIAKMTGNVSRAAAAQRVLNNTMKANVWVALAGVILTVAVAVAEYFSNARKAAKATKELTAEQKRQKKEQESLGGSVDALVAKFYKLQTQWKNLKSTADKNKWIKDNQSAFHELGVSIKDVNDAENVLVKNAGRVIEALKAVAEAKAYSDLYEEAVKKQAENERKAGGRVKYQKAKNGNLTEEEKNYLTRQGFYGTGGGYSEEALRKVDAMRIANARKTSAEVRKVFDDEVDYYAHKMNEANAKALNAKSALDEANEMTTAPVSEKEKKKEEAERKKREAAVEKALRKKAGTAKAERDKEMAEEMLKYRKGEVTYSEYMENRYNVTMSYYDKMKTIYGKDSDEYKKLLDEREKEEMKFVQDRRKMKEDDLSLDRLERDHRIRMQFEDRENKETYQNNELLKENLFQSEIEYLKAKQGLHEKGSKEWEELEQKINGSETKHKYELEENYMKMFHEYRKKFAMMSAEELEEIELKSVEKMFKNLVDEGKMTEGEYKEIIQNIKLSFADIKAGEKTEKGTKATGGKALQTAKKSAGIQETEGDENLVSSLNNVFSAVEQQEKINDALKDLYEQGAIDYATYEEAKRQNAKETADTMLAASTNALGQISQMLGSVSSYMQACSDLETAKISKNYQAQIDAAGNNSRKREKLEKERDEELRKAKTKANKKAMAIEIAQALASTALAAINAYSSAAKIPVTGWIMAPIAAGMATAAGMLQIATIKKQQQAQEAGYYSGGYTGGRDYRKKAGVVHEGEFVANHYAVNNPNLMPVFDLIDHAQRNNMAASLTARDVTNVMGGPASTAIVPVVNVQADMEELRENLDAVSEAVATLNDTLQVPIKAQLSMQELDKEYKRYNNLLKSK